MNDAQHPQQELATADIARLLKLLPHRYPFLLVDRMYDMDRDESAVGVKNVTINEPFFQGHFPNFPAGALCVHSLGESYTPHLVYFMGIDRAKFRKPVVPGDQLFFHVKKIRNRGRAWRFMGEAKVDGKTVAEAEISAMIVDSEETAHLHG